MRKPSKSEWFKIGAAVLLLVCFFLPFSSCKRSIDENGFETVYSHKQAIKEVKIYNYPHEMIFTKLNPDFIFLACFIWPVPILIFRYLSSRKTVLLSCWIIEAVIAAGSFIRVHLSSTILVKPEIGAYLMQVAYSVYLMACLYQAMTKVISKNTGASINGSVVHTSP